MTAQANDYTWSQINKATSSIADITTRSHTLLTDIGTFQLHRSGKGQIPKGFEDVYLCDLLGITSTELSSRPADWVDRMRLWHEQKAKAEEVRQKEQARKARRH